MANIALIAALDANGAIGYQNALPWHLPDDLKRFKAMTTGKTVLMGRKTAESLGRALPNRRNLVLSRSAIVPFEDMQSVSSVEQALAMCHDTLMVIGGGEIYRLTLPMAQWLYLTHVDTALADADTWFPDFASEHWLETSDETHAADDRHAFAFRCVDYFRIGPI